MIKIVNNNKKIEVSTNRQKVEYRLESMGCKKKEFQHYTMWKLFNNDNVFIRTSNHTIRVRLFSMEEPYEVKELKYNEFTFECNNEQLIRQLLG